MVCLFVLLAGLARAGDGVRTRDIQLGRLELYQLSYSRTLWWRGKDSNLRSQWRQIYSLVPLTAREPLRGSRAEPPGVGRRVFRNFCSRFAYPPWSVLRRSWRWESNPQPADYKSAALPLSYASTVCGPRSPPFSRCLCDLAELALLPAKTEYACRRGARTYSSGKASCQANIRRGRRKPSLERRTPDCRHRIGDPGSSAGRRPARS